MSRNKPVLPVHRKRLQLLIAGLSVLFVSCGGGESNVNAPKGSAIGDRYQDFMKVVAHAKTLPAGSYDSPDLPPELRLKNLIQVYVDRRRAYALEFPSIPIDSNPIYIFVDQETPDLEGVARACVKITDGILQ